MYICILFFGPDCHKPLGKYIKSVVLPYVINHVIIIKVAIMLPVDSWFQGSMISRRACLIHVCPVSGFHASISTGMSTCNLKCNISAKCNG